MRIVVVCGTNREGALSRKLAAQVAEFYRSLEHDVDIVDMAELPPETLAPSAYQRKPPGVQDLVV